MQFPQFPEHSQPTFFYIRDQTGHPTGVVALRMVHLFPPGNEVASVFNVSIALCNPHDAWVRTAGVNKAVGRLLSTQEGAFETVSFRTAGPNITLEKLIFEKLTNTVGQDLKLYEIPAMTQIHAFRRMESVDLSRGNALFEKQMKFITARAIEDRDAVRTFPDAEEPVAW